MECGNKYFETNNLIFITNRIKIIKIQGSFYVRVCVCRKQAMASSIKMICSPVYACVHVGEVYWTNVSIVGQSKKDKNCLYLHTCFSSSKYKQNVSECSPLSCGGQCFSLRLTKYSLCVILVLSHLVETTEM